jgi:hypothetical protein
MKRTFIQTKEFSKQWDRLGYGDEALRQLELDILRDPAKYPVMQGTGALRKARFSYGNEGKSGGVRVCYVDFAFAGTTYLITVYPKNEKENLTNEERNNIKKLIALLRYHLGG